jgi:superfamily II DNA helicase RecQ
MAKRIDDATIKSREEFVRESLPKLFGERIKPKQAQVECIERIVFNRQDVILTAKTGFGKSLIMQSVSFFFKHGVTVCILPLNAIGKEQESAITAAGGRVLFLNSDTSQRVYKMQYATCGSYSHIIISPELALGEEARIMFTDPGFRKMLALIVVDEAHLVHWWGSTEFRKEYGNLGQLRALVGPRVPWFACSATLDKKTMDVVRASWE